MNVQPASEDLVWHYTDATGLLSIVRSHTLWATSSAFLNDRQEVRLGADLMYERIRRLAAEDSTGWFGAIAERMSAAGEDGALPSGSHFFILSGSQASDSLAMWRLYGGHQESYAIGLDPSEALGVLAVSGGAVEAGLGTSPTRTPAGLMLRRMPWAPVHYQPVRQREVVDGLINRLPDRLATLREQATRGEVIDPASGGELPIEIAELLDDLTEALLLIKHQGFIDERETRSAVVAWTLPDAAAPVAAEAELLRYRPSPYGITPYLALTGTTAPTQMVVPEPSRLPIRAVAISPSPNGEESRRSIRRLLTSAGYGDLPVVASAIPFRAG